MFMKTILMLWVWRNGAAMAGDFAGHPWRRTIAMLADEMMQNEMPTTLFGPSSKAGKFAPPKHKQEIRVDLIWMAVLIGMDWLALRACLHES
ncbi:hypothetical protein Nepgr_028809 [Nepenthes gracilis]|uniref:Uncharacterized protein n=1 Tax=Nepenthes gracilis TaxID=150966 RepID=A0AAD3TD76_NEPGR|nr:hypothetical protein Nepgr_028809 [Nepenthes gracilis]